MVKLKTRWKRSALLRPVCENYFPFVEADGVNHIQASSDRLKVNLASIGCKDYLEIVFTYLLSELTILMHPHLANLKSYQILKKF